MNNSTNQPGYIIKKRRTGQWYWGWSLFLLLALVMAAVFGYWLSFKRYDLTETAQQQIEQMTESLSEADANAIKWEQQFEVEKQVNEELKAYLLRVENRLSNVRKEQQAYQRIFDPNSVESGIQVASLIWEKVSNRSYTYKLILIQAKQQLRNLKGNYSIFLIGTENGKPKEYEFSKISDLTGTANKFTFRYMEHRQGSFSIPENFKPKVIRVVVTTTGRGGKTILQDFSWNTQSAPEPLSVSYKGVEKGAKQKEAYDHVGK